MRRTVPLTLAAAVCLHAAAPDFVKDVQPIFRKRCSGCHGATQQQNGLRWDDREIAMKGGYSGVAIVKGNSAESKLIARVTSDKERFRMPPAGARLPEAEVATLKAWIDAGAPWPDSVAKAPQAKSTHWSFQPVKRTPVPAGTKSAIDYFIRARLAKEGFTPSPEADKVTLLRRVTLDLTGLPPTARETDEFLADTSADAYEKQVDRLLRSPHYGERWARQWMDLAHYADSDGYEKDQQRPWAWRYRHWLIQAFNDDLPFDRFTIEQLAGDLLPNPTVEQRVATGFLRNTLTNREAGVDRDETRFEQLVNRTNTFGTTWLGLAVGCAQCHNHKYDPITQRDYYQILSYFDRTDERDIDAPLPGELGPYLAAIQTYREQRQKLLDEYEVPKLMPQWEEKLRMAINDPGKQPEWDFALTSMKVMFDRTVKILTTPPDQREPRDRERLVEYFVYSNSTSIGLDKTKIFNIGKDLRGKLTELKKTLPPFSQAQVMVHDPSAGPTKLRIRGAWNAYGIDVASATPAFLTQPGKDAPTRLDLARWLVSRDHPLTARVWVNRTWQEFFGRGIVKTSEDFGKQGERPVHPELLDWLAAEFMDSGWSMKRMHKTIAMSATYRQTSKARPELEQKDPENTLLARQSRLRLSGESIRDAALAVSGLLDDEVGGRSVKPPQPAGVAELGYGGQKWIVTQGKERYRRGVYVHFQRTTPFPMLMNFDSPDMSVACSRRGRSNTALQALNLLNDEVFFEAAQAMAYRIENEAPASLTDRIDYAFRMCLARKPSEKERARLAAYHDQQARVSESGKDLAPWVGLSRVLMNLDEFVTRE
ncbi:MAG: PSD1 and planctomycete cytochrome C domain-containing protein [Bryobacteraceae bacterium]